MHLIWGNVMYKLWKKKKKTQSEYFKLLLHNTKNCDKCYQGKVQDIMKE